MNRLALLDMLASIGSKAKSFVDPYQQGEYLNSCCQQVSILSLPLPDMYRVY